jgi:hypothetical protein
MSRVPQEEDKAGGGLQNRIYSTFEKKGRFSRVKAADLRDQTWSLERQQSASVRRLRHARRRRILLREALGRIVHRS